MTLKFKGNLTHVNPRDPELVKEQVNRSANLSDENLKLNLAMLKEQLQLATKEEYRFKLRSWIMYVESKQALFSIFEDELA